MTDFELFRRRFLQGGTALGVTSLLPWGIVGASESSPDLEKFVQPLPIPEVREPDGTKKGADYHRVELQEFEQKVHPDLPPTTLWGFDGQVPGPILKARRNERLKVEFDNTALPEEHAMMRPFEVVTGDADTDRGNADNDQGNADNGR